MYAPVSEPGFVADDGKLSDQAYAKQSMLERARRVQEKNEAARAAAIAASQAEVIAGQRAGNANAGGRKDQEFLGPPGADNARAKSAREGEEGSERMEDVNLGGVEEQRTQHLENVGHRGG